MKRYSPLIVCFILAFSLALEVGCSKKPDDTKISSDIQSKFSQDSGLASKQLSVQSQAGVVTLSGTVDNDAQRDAASRQAGSVPGVKEVINNLQVGSTTAAAQMPQPAAEPTAEASPAPEKEKPIADKKKPAKHKSNSSSNMDDMQGRQMTADSTPPPAAAAQPEPTPPPAPAPPPPPKKYIIDQGTQLTVRLVDAVDSEKNKTGDTIHATLNTPLTSDGEEAVSAGADVVGHLVEVKSAGKFAGQSSVIMQLDSLSFAGRSYNLQTDQYKKQGSSRGKNTAEKVGAGAAIGGIIGALAGGGKGAAIGAAAGGGLGGGVQAATKGQQIKLPSETVLNFTLQAPITVVQATTADSNRPKLGNSQ
ncbi:MAG TPA: BON domain-containing protein [Candidatus Sulfotelmatobacter sp.]|nr:BON domain-containing protein [Candidatus Sulfotelmatobacter sp.]